MLRLLVLLSCLLVVGVANAEWTAPAKVEKINIGGNGVYGTYIKMMNTTFSGCSTSTVAIVKGDNPNYKEILAAFMSVKVTQQELQVFYAGCDGSYAVIKEVTL